LNPETPTELASRVGYSAVLASKEDLYMLKSTSKKQSSPEAGARMWLTHEEDIAPETVDTKAFTVSSTVVLVVISAAFAVGVVTALGRLWRLCRQEKVEHAAENAVPQAIAV